MTLLAVDNPQQCGKGEKPAYPRRMASAIGHASKPRLLVVSRKGGNSDDASERADWAYRPSISRDRKGTGVQNETGGAVDRLYPLAARER